MQHCWIYDRMDISCPPKMSLQDNCYYVWIETCYFIKFVILLSNSEHSKRRLFPYSCIIYMFYFILTVLVMVLQLLICFNICGKSFYYQFEVSVYIQCQGLWYVFESTANLDFMFQSVPHTLTYFIKIIIV